MRPAEEVVSGPLRRLGASMLALLRIRLELLAIELQEEKDRVVRMLVWAVVTAFLGCFALVFVAAFVTVALWDSHRLLALGVFSLLFVALAAWGALELRRIAGASPTLFRASLGELRNDSRALDPQRAP
jgi:uncharacterized membrane protein YqjE